MSPREWLRRVFRLGVVVARNEIWLFRRNPMEGIGVTLIVGALLAAAYFGAKSLIANLSHNQGGQTSWIVASFVMLLVTQGYQRVGNALYQQAQTGTLEQSAMSPLGLSTVVIVTFIAWLLTNLVPMVPVALLLMISSGHWIQGDPLTLVVLFACLIASVLGMALLFGGLTLVFKRMQIVTGIIALPFIALIAMPVDKMPYLSWLPIALPNWMLERASASGVSLWQEPAWEVAVLLVSTFVYLVAGVWMFQWMDQTARLRGVLGQY